MVVDSHVYCFPPADSPAGFPSVADHMAYVQFAQAGHHQPAWRIRDRAPADAAPRLAALGKPGPFHLADANFRIDRASGCVVWTVGGQGYTKQFYPPNLRHPEYSPESILAE